MWLASLCSVSNKILDLAPPALIGAAIDVVVKRQDSWIASFGYPSVLSQLVVLAVATVLIWAGESLFEYLHKVLWRNLAQTVQHELRVEAYAHAQGLDLAYFEDQSVGGLMSVLNNDVNQLERFLDGGANDLLQLFTTVVCVGAVFVGAAPTVAALAFLPVPIVIWGSIWFQRRIAPRYAVVREKVGDLNARLANNLSGIATIKSFTTEDTEAERIAGESAAYQASNQHAIRLSSAFSPLIRMAIVVAFAATLIYGGWLTERGELEVGVYGVLVFLTQRLLWPLTGLGSTIDLYQRAMASTRRILDLLDLRPAVVSGEQALPRSGVRGEIRFEAASFVYGNGTRVLDALDLEVPAGETIALVGSTGSGKTTIVKLLLRFYDLTGGRVTLDGHDLRSLRLEDLRDAVGLVSQDVFLFDGTVRANLSYARPGATDAELEAAARVAEAHDFIVGLPRGYDTPVGERGQKLSGGQRQRLSIARAVLKDPPILVFDEATSSVDNETEAAIQRSIDRISEGRTTILIAHRLSTIRNADRIYVLADGGVVESGTHDQLVAAGGAYADLWRVQTGERGRDTAS